MKRASRKSRVGELVFWAGGVKYVVDAAGFIEFLRRLGVHGYVGTVGEFERLSDEEKANYLEGYRIYSGGAVKKFDVYGKPVESPAVYSGKDLDIPLPV